KSASRIKNTVLGTPASLAAAPEDMRPSSYSLTAAARRSSAPNWSGFTLRAKRVSSGIDNVILLITVPRWYLFCQNRQRLSSDHGRVPLVIESGKAAANHPNEFFEFTTFPLRQRLCRPNRS